VRSCQYGELFSSTAARYPSDVVSELVQGSCTGVTAHDLVVAEPGTEQYGSVGCESPVAHVVIETSTRGATCGWGVGVGVGSCGEGVGIGARDGAGEVAAEGHGVRGGVGLAVAGRVAGDDEEGAALGVEVQAMGVELGVSAPDGVAAPFMVAVGFADPE
jgi:hypothetical protein